MDRRGFLAGLTTSVAAALSGCGSHPSSAAAPSPNPTDFAGTTVLQAPAGVFRAPTGLVQIPVPQGTVTMLPGKGNYVALTVDDGTDSKVLKAYLLLAQRTGLRLTFFANGSMPSWTEHAPLLRPLVEQGQAIICNHTWSHPDLTHLSDVKIADEIQRNEGFLKNTYGITGRPFLRPPYGNHNAQVDRMLAALGYPAVTMWWGSLADSTPEQPAQILANAEKWFLPQRLVIGHANHPGVLSVMDKIVDIIKERNLQPVHLADIFDLTRLPAIPPMPTSTTPQRGSPAPSPSPSRPTHSPTSSTSPTDHLSSSPSRSASGPPTP